MLESVYTPQTKPYELQLDVWEATRERRNFAFFWEMGTGKTKLAVDTAGWLYCTGKIDAVFVLAPTDIHANWDIPGDGIRKHLPEELLRKSMRLTWRSNKASSRPAQVAFERLLAHQGGMRWLFMGFDAVNTDRGFKAAQAFLRGSRCLWVMDEAARIKNPTAKRTKRVMKLRDLAAFRRPMTGTPIAQKPFDVYSIVNWMDPFYWRKNGIGNFQAFKHYFGVWRKIRVAMGREVEVQKTNNAGRPVYQNLDELQRLLGPISSRVLLTDVKDMPSKTYQRLYYELLPKQRVLYDKLEEEFIIWYMENTQRDEADPDGPRLLTTSADLAIVRQLRLYQLALGYLVSDDGDVTMLAEGNPALDLLMEAVEDLSSPAIIWGRFRKDIDLICNALGDRAVRYDGTVDAEGRRRAVAAMQAGDAAFFVGTQATAGEGLTLTAARHAFYYSNSRRLTDRLQSEFRNWRIGQEHPVSYVDLLGRGTIAEDILEGLLHGQDVAATALGDKIRQRRGR